MLKRCTIDFETKSELDLARVGVWEYSLHESTEIIVMCWRFDDWEPGRVDYWLPGTPVPRELMDAVKAGCLMEAHNYSFEHAIWANVLSRADCWVPVQPEQWRDTMAVACYYAMPAKLDALLRALHMPGKLRSLRNRGD